MTSIPPRNKNTKNSDADIYRDYTTARTTGRPLGDVLLKYGISRSNLYDIIHRVRHGNPGKIRRDVEKAHLDALWEHKYKARYLALPKNREASTVEILRKLIHDMNKDKFPQAIIAAHLGKDRSTIIHHLEN